VQGSAFTITNGTAKPWSSSLCTSNAEGPFSLELNNLGLTVDGDGDLSPAETADAQYRVIF